MKPYYSDEWVTLYHGDCREVTAWLEADVLVTDPPYGMQRDVSGGQRVSGDRDRRTLNWTPTFERTPEWNKSLEVRDAVLSMWGERPSATFGSARRIDAAPPHREVPLIWDKENIGMGDTSFPWGRGYELIYINGDGWHGPRTTAIIRCHLNSIAARSEGHPTPKPVGLMDALITKAPPGVIADPFAGSGSTLVAAKQLARRAIGVEIDERYCEIAARRLAQDTLFGEVTA